jgi:hypothetical protein
MKRKLSDTFQDTSTEHSGSSNASSTKSLIIGTQDFDRIIEKDALIIDKTLFIKDFIQDSAIVTAILRPRRFGKSLNLSMLKSFLSLGQTPTNFSQYLIGKETDFVQKHCGKYPIVMLDFKDCKGDSWEEMNQEVWLCIRNMVKPHLSLLADAVALFDSTELDFRRRNPPQYFADILKWLINSLYEKHDKKRVIVLVDEYDSPLNHAFRHGYYDKASKFFGSFYSQALKGNNALEKACLMGIVEVRGAGILSGLNNIKVFSVANDRYSSHFGFTESELCSFLGEDTSMIQNVKDWYNGYQIGNYSLVNPWSFVNCFADKTFKPYWVSSANEETIATVLSPHIKSAMKQIFELLFDNKKVLIPKLVSQVNYSESNWETPSILHFLVHTGYLTYEANVEESNGSVWIPNKEVRMHWEEHVIKLLKTTLDPLFQESLANVVLAQPFDITSLENVMREMVQYCSYYDLKSENSYHVFYYGCLFTILHDGETLSVSSNKESGHGRYDICIKLADLKRVLIIEFKHSKKSAKALDKDAKAALEQIKKRDYFSGVKDFECIIVGVSFYRKQMSNLAYEVFSK